MAKPKFKIRETEKYRKSWNGSATRAAQLKVYMVLVPVYPKFRAQMFLYNFTAT
jgi:hypothetical protein